jgi:hypothetical protein
MGNTMDEGFYVRSDAHVKLSNEQIAGQATPGKVAASMMFSVARYDAWVTACELGSPEAMKEARERTIDYFTGQYRMMFEDNFDDYVKNFDQYLQVKR